MIGDQKCDYGKQDLVMLSLTSCNSSFFTCDNGECVPMSVRCDKGIDCMDKSDEKNCKRVVLDEANYIKDEPPKKADIKVKVELLNIIDIAEKDSVFQSQFKIYMKWFDERLIFHNLQKNKVRNRLNSQEKSKVWTPTLIFENTGLKLRTKTDEEAVVYIERVGTFTRSGIDHIDNDYIFDGKDNALEINRIYNIAW